MACVRVCVVCVRVCACFMVRVCVRATVCAKRERECVCERELRNYQQLLQAVSEHRRSNFFCRKNFLKKKFLEDIVFKQKLFYEERFSNVCHTTLHEETGLCCQLINKRLHSLKIQLLRFKMIDW